MNAVPIGIMGSNVQATEFPPDDTLLHILLGQREREFTEYGFSDWQFILSVYIGFVFESVFVKFMILVHEPIPLSTNLLTSLSAT